MLKTISIVAALGFLSAGAAQAGCLTGAAVGGVAGHMAGHHGLLGAAAGCAIGHHHDAKKQEERARQTDSNAMTH